MDGIRKDAAVTTATVNEDREIDEPSPAESTEDSVTTRLKQFQVIRNPYLRWIVARLPLIFILILLFDWLIGLDWLMGANTFRRDLFRLSFAVGLIIEFLIINSAFSKLPEALETVWTRGLIRARNGASASEPDYVNFIETVEAKLNSKLFIVVGVVLALVILRATFPFVYWARYGEFPPGGINPFIYVEMVIGFFAGFIVWRVGVIAFYVGNLAKSFKLKIQPNHPDKCGGLKPLGDLCLTNAYIVLVPVIFLSIWIVAASYSGFEIYELWSGLFRQYLVALSLISIFLFFQPLYSIHRQMRRRRREIQHELDELSARAEHILFDLRTRADTLSPDDANEHLKTLEFFRKIHSENGKLPTWPFEWRIILKFSSAQAIPILSLIGIGEPILEIISTLLQSINGTIAN